MLNGKIAVVTGGSRGIGAAVAKKMASLGADIAIIFAGNEAMAEAVCEECQRAYHVRAKAYRCDVSDYEAVKACVAQIKADFGLIHILINNAGVTRDALIATMKETDFDSVLATNLKGAFNLIRHCTGIFMRNRYGRIVNVSSVSGLMGNPGQSNYASSKAGLIGLTKSVAKELGSRNITCNAVAPGFIDTDMTKALSRDGDAITAAIPLGRTGCAEDVAQTVAFLVEADYITGEVIRVDGGMGM